jgi:outer membrane protein assembly factor BamB
MRCRVVDHLGASLPGVVVSDGATVVVSDGDGRAHVPPAGRPFVWVRRPTGFETTRWFHRCHDSDEEVVFELTPTPQSLPVTFAQITDLHLSDLPEPASMPQADSLIGLDADQQIALKPLAKPEHLEAVIDELAATTGPLGRPSFIVATGDLTDRGVAADFTLVTNAIADAALPVHVLPGNHDHYGHRHDPTPEEMDEGPAATTWRYEEHVGPRWWSLTHAGLHLVALDWFSHHLALDAEIQDAWLAADLATLPTGTPVLMLTHDQMSTDFYEHLDEVAPHVRVLGSLSGHWHTSRVVRHRDQLHANTGNATFGSFDWTPAHGRLVSWDGQSLSLQTVALGTDQQHTSATFRARNAQPIEPASSTWSVRLPGSVHLARPVVVGEGAIVAWSDDDQARGGLVHHDLGTGGSGWSVDLDAPIKAGVTALHDLDLVVAATVCGEVFGVDATTGEVRWRTQVGDRLRTWVHAAPVDLGDAVAVGEVGHYASLDAIDGSPRWERCDLDGAENYATTMQGVLRGEILVAGFSFIAPHTYGFDADTGATLWQRDHNRLAAPASDLVPDPDCGDVYVTRLGGIVERFDAATGEPRWRGHVQAAFASGRPLIHDNRLVVTTGLGEVTAFDTESGEQLWTTALPGDRVLSMGPYRRDRLAVPSGPAQVAGSIAQTTGDGRVHLLRPSTGALERSIEVGEPMTVAALPIRDGFLAATAEGSLIRFDL